MCDIEKRTLRKIRRNLLYFLLALYTVNVLDRINLSFAALRMNAQLGFNAEVYGFGAGVFFIGYLLLEIPSNYLMSRYGGRVWLARIAISWGLLAILMAFVYDRTSFYLLRFLLGAAEAGLVPGILYFISLWVPRRNRGVAILTFALAIPVSAIIGAPISGWLLAWDRVGGLAGWQWMFVVEGIPSVILGFLTLRVLVDRPALTTWLEPAERDWLTAELAREDSDVAVHGLTTFSAALRDIRVWVCALTFFCITMTTYGLTYWLPQIVKEFAGSSDFTVSLISAIPFVGMGLGMLLTGWLSDRAGERSFHFATVAIVAAGGILIACLSGDARVTLCGMTVCAFGLGGAIAVFWPIPMNLLTDTAAVGGFALINMAGNAAGFVGSYMIGWIRQHTNSFSAAFGVLSALLLAAALLIIGLRLAQGASRTVTLRRAI